MAEATLTKDANANSIEVTAPEALSAGEIIQLPDGRAAVTAGLQTVASGDPATLHTSGKFTVTKTSGVVVLDGGRVYWDRSADSATPLKAAAGADFFLGVAVGDAASTDTTMVVDLNVQPSYTIDLQRDPGETIVVLTAGTPHVSNRGASMALAFSATAEAQKLDWISNHSVPVATPMILEAIFCVSTAADADVADFNIGLANATHATDADSITEAVFFHNDSGADLNLDAESDDGETEVAATDTTVDLVANTWKEVWIDCRVRTAIKLYVDGVQVLTSTTFTLSNATGPMKALVHLEKTVNDTAGEFRVSHLAVRTPDVT